MAGSETSNSEIEDSNSFKRALNARRKKVDDHSHSESVDQKQLVDSWFATGDHLQAEPPVAAAKPKPSQHLQPGAILANTGAALVNKAKTNRPHQADDDSNSEFETRQERQNRKSARDASLKPQPTVNRPVIKEDNEEAKRRKELFAQRRNAIAVKHQSQHGEKKPLIAPKNNTLPKPAAASASMPRSAAFLAAREKLNKAKPVQSEPGSESSSSSVSAAPVNAMPPLPAQPHPPAPLPAPAPAPILAPIANKRTFRNYLRKHRGKIALGLTLALLCGGIVAIAVVSSGALPIIAATIATAIGVTKLIGAALGLTGLTLAGFGLGAALGATIGYFVDRHFVKKAQRNLQISQPILPVVPPAGPAPASSSAHLLQQMNNAVPVNAPAQAAPSNPPIAPPPPPPMPPKPRSPKLAASNNQRMGNRR